MRPRCFLRILHVACIDCTDNVGNRSDKFSLCNTENSRATNACTRTTHRLEVKVFKNTQKSRLVFNQISLFVPKNQPHMDIFTVALDKLGNVPVHQVIALALQNITQRRQANKRPPHSGSYVGVENREELNRVGCVAIYKHPADCLTTISFTPPFSCWGTDSLTSTETSGGHYETLSYFTH